MKKFEDLSFKVKSLSQVHSPMKKEKMNSPKAFESFSYQGTRDYNEDRILIK